MRIRLELEPFQGKVEYRVIEIKVPAELAGREVEIDLVPGYEVERPLPVPDNVAELMANINHMTFEPDSIVATFRVRGTSASYRGKIANRLPAGAIDILRPSSDSGAPEIFASQVQTAIPLKRFIIGRDSVRVQIRPVIR